MLLRLADVLHFLYTSNRVDEGRSDPRVLACVEFPRHREL